VAYRPTDLGLTDLPLACWALIRRRQLLSLKGHWRLWQNTPHR
jgi:hypothetical protein